MTPTREQFKELMAFIKNAQEKEDKVNDALKIIWDDDQGQYPPFYISPWWTAVRYAFCLLFNLDFNRLGIIFILLHLADLPCIFDLRSRLLTLG